MLPLKRTRQRAALFVALGGVVAIVTGLGVGLSGYLSNAEVEGARVELATSTGADVALEASLDLVDEAQAQDSTMRTVLADTFRSNGKAIAIDIERYVATVSMVTFEHDELEKRALFESISDLPDVATLVDGSWATGPTDVTIQADAAQLLDLGVGDVLSIDDRELTVSGTWRVNDPLDPRWFDNVPASTGSAELRVGPVMIDEEQLAGLDVAARAAWTVIPDARRITNSELAAIGGTWKTLPAAVREAGLDSLSLDQTGRLVRTAAEFESRANALRAVQPVALLIIAAIAIVAVVELARLLAGLRAAELLLLWSRGARVRRLATANALEVTAVTALGALVGVVAACAALLAVGGTAAIDRLGQAVWLIPLVTVLFAVVVFTTSTTLGLRALSHTDQLGGSGRAQRLGGRGVVALVVVAAAISVWQLLLYGSPITPSRSGGTQVDPIAVLAPSLALLALVLIGATTLPLVARALERRAARRTGFSQVLSARTLSRRSAIALTPFVLVALACGQLVVAASYAQTWDDSFTASRQLRTGAETRVTGGRLALTPAVIERIVGTTGVTGVAPVYTDSTAISANSAYTLAVAPAALARLALDNNSVLDRGALATEITVPAPGAPLPAGASSIELDVTATGFASLPTARLLLSSPWSDLRSVDLTPTGDSYSADIPALPNGLDGSWQLVGIEIDLPQTHEDEAALVIDAAEVDGKPLALDRGWTAVQLNGELPLEIESPESGVGFVSTFQTTRVRITPRFGEGDDALAIPVAISQSLAESTGVELGDSVPIALDARLPRFTCTIAAIEPAIPGSNENETLLVDASVMQAILLRGYPDLPTPSQAWIATTDTVGVAHALRATLPAQVSVESLAVDPSRDILRTASDALWIGAAGTILLALVALGAVVGAQLRSRRGEVLVLRALGISAAAQGSMRRAELGAVLASSIVAGVVAGLVVSLLTVPPLARAAVPAVYDSIATALHFAVVPLAASIVLIVLVMGGMALVYGRGVVTQARRATGRDESE